MKDKFGNEVQIGDIVLSASGSGTVVIGPVCTVRDDNVTIMENSLSPIYAYEHGAPSIKTKSTRIKRNESGYPVRKADGGGYEYEDYEYETKDYTVVGQRRGLRKRVSAYTVIILRKFDGTVTPELLEKLKP